MKENAFVHEEARSPERIAEELQEILSRLDQAMLDRDAAFENQALSEKVRGRKQKDVDDLHIAIESALNIAKIYWDTYPTVISTSSGLNTEGSASQLKLISQDTDVWSMFPWDVSYQIDTREGKTILRSTDGRYEGLLQKPFGLVPLEDWQVGVARFLAQHPNYIPALVGAKSPDKQKAERIFRHS